MSGAVWARTYSRRLGAAATLCLLKIQSYTLTIDQDDPAVEEFLSRQFVRFVAMHRTQSKEKLDGDGFSARCTRLGGGMKGRTEADAVKILLLRKVCEDATNERRDLVVKG